MFPGGSFPKGAFPGGSFPPPAGGAVVVPGPYYVAASQAFAAGVGRHGYYSAGSDDSEGYSPGNSSSQGKPSGV